MSVRGAVLEWLDDQVEGLEQHANHDCGQPKSCEFIGRCVRCSQAWPCDAGQVHALIEAERE